MVKEKIFIGVLAIILGVGFAGGLFYLWQSTKVIPAKLPKEEESNSKIASIPKPLLTIDSPVDESVIDKRIIPVMGKATDAKLIIVSTNTQDLVLKPASDGSFSTNVTLGIGANAITIVAITKDNQQISQNRVVTFTTEAF